MASVEESDPRDSNSSSEEEEEEEKQSTGVLKFKNDGSFLEMFKKMQEKLKNSEDVASCSSTVQQETSCSSEVETANKQSCPDSVHTPVVSEKKKEEIAQKKPGLMSVVS